MTEFKKLTDEELNKVTAGINWIKYGQCLLSHGATAVPQLAELTAAVKANDWAKVAVISKKSGIAANPIVTICLADS